MSNAIIVQSTKCADTDKNEKMLALAKEMLVEKGYTDHRVFPNYIEEKDTQMYIKMKSLGEYCEHLSGCNLVLFINGWQSNKECKLMYQIALAYALDTETFYHKDL